MGMAVRYGLLAERLIHYAAWNLSACLPFSLSSPLNPMNQTLTNCTCKSMEAVEWMGVMNNADRDSKKQAGFEDSHLPIFWDRRAPGCSEPLAKGPRRSLGVGAVTT